MNKAVCTAIRRTAISEASMLTVRRKPETWQNVELESMGTLAKKARGQITSHNAFIMSL